jgi:predicted flap endonuclease-1-like 5' DNA nuclease
VKRLEKVIWFGLIPVTAAALAARRLARELAGPATTAPHGQPTPAPAVLRPAPAAAAVEDDLKVINGIGPVYEQRLKAAGVRTLSALVATSPERLLEIVNATPGLADTESWIAEARQHLAG